MFGLIRKSKIKAKIELAVAVGLKDGLELGIQIGRMQAGDPGIIVSARVRQQVEKILKDSKF